MFASLLIGTLWTLLSTSPNEVYMGNSRPYDELYAVCEGKGGRACCRASVHAVKRAQSWPITLAQGCPEGQKVTSLSCPASLVWCEAHKTPFATQDVRVE